MKIVDLSCPHCGASLHIGAGQKEITCKYCCQTLYLDDEGQHFNYSNAEQAGYEFEKGRQRAINESNSQRSGFNTQNNGKTASKKRGSCWRFFLWLFFFPVMLSIWFWKADIVKDKRIRALIIIVFWILLVMCSNESNSTSSNNTVTGAATTENSSVFETTKNIPYQSTFCKNPKIDKLLIEFNESGKGKITNDMIDADRADCDAYCVFGGEDNKVCVILSYGPFGHYEDRMTYNLGYSLKIQGYKNYVDTYFIQFVKEIVPSLTENEIKDGFDSLMNSAITSVSSDDVVNVGDLTCSINHSVSNEDWVNIYVSYVDSYNMEWEEGTRTGKPATE